MACLTPATCHSLTSRYSLSASAARNDRLRPVLLASFSSRLLTSVSTRTVNVVEDIANYLVTACVQITTRYGSLQILGRVVDRAGLALGSAETDTKRQFCQQSLGLTSFDIPQQFPRLTHQSLNVLSLFDGFLRKHAM